MKRILLLSTFIFLILGNIFTPLISGYLEESSYFWYWTSQREIIKKRYNYIFLGDSQWISGIDLSILAKNLNVSENDILIYAKPSQQLEGIELDLKFLKSKGITADHYLINLSSTSTTVNKVFYTFKNLELSFGINSWKILIEPNLWRTFYKDIGSYFYHAISEVCLLLKFNSNTTSLFKIIPTIDSDFTTSKDLETRLGPNIFDLLNSTKRKNLIMKDKLGSKGLWDWKNYTQDNSSNECIEKISLPKLDQALKLAFAKERKDAINILQRIATHSIDMRSDLTLVNIPFTAQMREIESVFPIVWKSLDSPEKRYKMIEIPSNNFDLRHYNDYTHFNQCGAKLFSEILSEKIK